MKKLINIACLLMIVAFTIIPFIPQPVQAVANWYNTSWLYRKSISITGTIAGVQTNYQLPIVVYYGSGTDGTTTTGNLTAGKVYVNTKSQTDFDDLRFTKSDGITKIDAWLDTKTNSNNATIFVEFDYIPVSPSTQTFFIYYGNATVASDWSSANTLIIEDNFGTGVNEETWTVSSGTWTNAAGGYAGNCYKESAVGGGRSDVVRAYNRGFYTRVRVYFEADTNDARIHFPGDVGTNDLVLFANSNAETFYMDDGSNTASAIALAATTWYTIEVFVNQSGIVYVYINQVLAITEQLSSTTFTSLGLESGGSFPVLRFDDVLVKKYVSIEPTFTTWGTEEYFNVNDKLVIQSVNIFKSYINMGDWLIAILYKNIFPPYYANKDNVKKYFSLQFLDVSYNVKAQVACPEWDYKPGSIYLNASQVTAFTWGGTYYVRLIGNFAGNPYIQYTIKATDWVDGNLKILDDWVLSSADLLGDYYSIGLTTPVTMTTYVADRGKLLNATGGVLFANGITGLLTQRPDIFQISSRTTAHPMRGDTSSGSGETLTTWQAMVGPYVTEQLNNGGILFGVDGKSFGAWILIIIMIALMAFGLPSGHTAPANILALPIFFMGLGLRFFDWATGAVMLSLMILLLWYNIWLKHG